MFLDFALTDEAALTYEACSILLENIFHCIAHSILVTHLTFFYFLFLLLTLFQSTITFFVLQVLLTSPTDHSSLS